YNQPPYQPSALKTLNGNGTDRGCVTGANRPYINTATPMLSALVKDPDGDSVSPHFQVYTKSGTTETEVWNSTTLTAQASNTTASATVTAGKLVENRQ